MKCLRGWFYVTYSAVMKTFFLIDTILLCGNIGALITINDIFRIDLFQYPNFKESEILGVEHKLNGVLSHF